MSLEKKDMLFVHNFTGLLKANKDFLEGLTEFELGSIQRRKVNKLDVVDFLITIKLINNEQKSTK